MSPLSKTDCLSARLLVAILIFLMAWIPIRLSFASTNAQVGASSSPAVTQANVAAPGGVEPQATATGPNGITYQICQTNQCFQSPEEKAQWAATHSCRFLEDICTQGNASTNSPTQDPGLWGSFLGTVQSAFDTVVGTVYDFSKGVFDGVKQQITDLWDLVSNPWEVAEGIVLLGKAFIQDPQGTLEMLAELAGQGAVDTITRATQCGAYDLGNVIGQYVSPAVALKLMGKLTKFSGKLRRAVDDLKADTGCASFVGGTPVLTPGGLVPIEKISIGDIVHARNEVSFADAPRRVENVFSRVSPGYHVLKTDVGTLSVTDEHPLWVQGKGWTEVKEIAKGDVVASRGGDALVRSNVVVASPITVYNFSVSTTHNYFAGEHGIWAHNSGCDLPPPYRAPASPSGNTHGESDGGPGIWTQPKSGRDKSADWYKYEKQLTRAPEKTEYRVGEKDFDGYDHERNVLLDAKFYGKNNGLYKPPEDFMFGIMKEAELKDMRNQVIQANGTKIEWHMSDPVLRDKLEGIFREDEAIEAALDQGLVKLIFTPDIVN